MAGHPIFVKPLPVQRLARLFALWWRLSSGQERFDSGPDSCKSQFLTKRKSKRQNSIHRAKALLEDHLGAARDYSGAQIREAATGLRRELTLRIELWPKEKLAFGGGELIAMHFGAIVNYEEVRRFFAKVPVDELHYLRELSISSARRRVSEMEFDRTGDRIRIIAGKVSKSAPRQSIRPAEETT